MPAGVFKNWPTSNASLVDVTKVEELRVLKQTEVKSAANHLLIIAQPDCIFSTLPPECSLYSQVLEKADTITY